jgi:hypothetical protein
MATSPPSRRATSAPQAEITTVVLGYLFPRDAVQLAALAEEANQSRIAAGIHYRSDTVAGRELGLAVAGESNRTRKSDGSD